MIFSKYHKMLVYKLDEIHCCTSKAVNQYIHHLSFLILILSHFGLSYEQNYEASPFEDFSPNCEKLLWSSYKFHSFISTSKINQNNSLIVWQFMIRYHWHFLYIWKGGSKNRERNSAIISINFAFHTIISSIPIRCIYLKITLNKHCNVSKKLCVGILFLPLPIAM